MRLQNFIEASCNAMKTKEVGRDNEIIGYNEAYYRVKTIYNANNIGAQEISIDKLRNYLDQIDAYNENNNLNSEAKITSLRLWKAVSHFNDNHKNIDDVVICPVRKDGDDAHAHQENLPIDPQRAELGKLEMLSSGRPCPNLCGTRKYFFLHDPDRNGFPPASGNQYRDVSFIDVTSEDFIGNFGENELIR